MAPFKVLVWNCGGLRDTAVSQNKAFFFEKDYKNDFDAAFFVETHHKDQTDFPRQILRFQKTHHIIHSPVGLNESHTGIIGLISHDYEILEQTELLRGRMLNVKIHRKSDKKKKSLTAVYLPTNNKLDEDFMQQIVSKLKESVGENEIILGDFNFVENEIDKTNGLNSTDKKVCKTWVPFLAETNLVDPFREQNPKRRIWSFIGTGKAKNSRIDRMYVNMEEMKNVTNMKYTPTPFHGHRVLTFQVKDANEHGKGYYKMNTSILRDKRYEEIVNETIEDIYEQNIDDDITKMEVFLLTIKAKSQLYSQTRNKVKRNLKNYIRKQITEIEESPQPLRDTEAHKYRTLNHTLKEIEKQEIEGYKTRIKCLPTFEKGEGDIGFFSKLEGIKIAKNSIAQLSEKKDGEIFTDNENLMRISTHFYTNLYTPNKVNSLSQDRLLKNIKCKINAEQKKVLDEPLNLEELERAVFSMKKGVSPGLDGIPIKFYQVFWNKIKYMFYDYINEARKKGFSKTKNTSVIKLLYKHKGEIYLLSNYRPISLMNVDVKILAKALANRLKYILPHIIHESQTAVYGRKIDKTIHTIRDLIDIANKEDEQAAFIFLDQEKAFDRVNHDFLYKTMKSFGFGDNFIEWIKILYSNVSAVLNINGFLSKQIPLKRGVRHGCPLSALLYVLVIEVLAIQLRINPNIVGFKIGEEKIVSAHYQDDATIIIRQNRCFKEVIKELKEYEQASGAKINYDKSKGLWTGGWKGRRVSPLDIEWTSGNVKNLGVFFGNENPGLGTYNQIIPDLIRRLHFWKQFHLSQIGKARVVEIFLASKLIYATKFYPLPENIGKQMQAAIYEYVTFPNKVKTIAQKEMWKIKRNGGLKLINLAIKSATAKAKWITEIVTNEDLVLNLNIFERLLGTFAGNIRGKDLVFLEKSYLMRHLTGTSPFYREGLLSLSRFQIKKGITTLNDWDKEHIFYNPLFTRTDGKTLKLDPYCKARKIFRYEQIIEEKRKQLARSPFDKRLVKILDSILVDTDVSKKDIFIPVYEKELDLKEVTQKILYEETLLVLNSQDHHSQGTLIEKLQIGFDWKHVWDSVHNILSSNETKTVIWQELHLNFYTQYSYNQWHKKMDVCPLCLKVPRDIFHIMLDCDLVNDIWQGIQPLLVRLYPIPVSNSEKVLGIVKNKQSTGTLLRNWLTFLLRKVVLDEEKTSFYKKSAPTIYDILGKFEKSLHDEIRRLERQHRHENRIDNFQKLIGFKDVLCTRKTNGNFEYIRLISFVNE